jgi:hypothetical protein
LPYLAYAGKTHWQTTKKFRKSVIWQIFVETISSSKEEEGIASAVRKLGGQTGIFKWQHGTVFLHGNSLPLEVSFSEIYEIL